MGTWRFATGKAEVQDKPEQRERHKMVDEDEEHPAEGGGDGGGERPHGEGKGNEAGGKGGVEVVRTSR